MMANTFVNMEEIGKERGREGGSKAMYRLKICQKIYTTGFSDQKFYTL